MKQQVRRVQVWSRGLERLACCFIQTRSREKERGLGRGSGYEPGCEAGGVVPDPEDRARDDFKGSHVQLEHTVEIRSPRADLAASESHPLIIDLDRTKTAYTGPCRPISQGKEIEGLGARSQAGVGASQQSGGGHKYNDIQV